MRREDGVKVSIVLCIRVSWTVYKRSSPSAPRKIWNHPASPRQRLKILREARLVEGPPVVGCQKFQRSDPHVRYVHSQGKGGDVDHIHQFHRHWLIESMSLTFDTVSWMTFDAVEWKTFGAIEWHWPCDIDLSDIALVLWQLECRTCGMRTRVANGHLYN